MNATRQTRSQRRVLRRISPNDSGSRNATGRNPQVEPEAAAPFGLAVPVAADLAGKQAALERIRLRLFVADANEPRFAAAQSWVEEAGAEVRLPLNFCGGLLIMRLYRLIAPVSKQTSAWMAAVHEAAAAYDFAFLALAHADDEADNTRVRDGLPTRFVTHPDTRAVDGVNLLLSGVTAMHDTLSRWPGVPTNGTAPTMGRHSLAAEILEMLVRALREASFPILLDRAGLGHASDPLRPSGLAPVLVDTQSMHRVAAFSRHRAHTYFMRATDLAVLLAGYDSIEGDLLAALDELFGVLGLLGATSDDIQDLFLDFAAGIHSACTVMAHLSVAPDAALRPDFRRDLSADFVRDQAHRLSGFFGVGDQDLDRLALLAFLEEIELRKALLAYFERHGALLAAAIYRAATQFGFSAKLIVELVAVVGGDPDFEVPEMFLSALGSTADDSSLAFMTLQVGKFVAEYLVDRFWPRAADFN